MSELEYPAGTLVWTLVEVDGPGPKGTIGLIMSQRYAGAKTVRFLLPDQIMAKDEVDALRARVAELEAILALTRAAYKRGAGRFRAAHPEYVVRRMWPDTGVLMEWLLERLEEAEGK